MNRRQFVAGAIVVTGMPHTMLAAPASPSAGGRPKSVSLADGLTITDYRFGVAYGRDSSIPMLFLELRNELDATYAVPQIVVSFLDNDGNILGSETAFADVPIVAAGSYATAHAEFYDFKPDDLGYTSLSFEIQGQWPYEADYYAFLPVKLTKEKRGDHKWQASAVVTNDTQSPAKNVMVYVKFRGSDSRFAAYTWGSLRSTLAPGKHANVPVDVSVNTIVPTDPFQFLGDDEKYTVSTVAYYMPTS